MSMVLMAVLAFSASPTGKEVPSVADRPAIVAKAPAAPTRRAHPVKRANILAQRGGGFAQPTVNEPAESDDGEAMAEMIQTTVRPRSWQRNGGFGSVYYWRPGRAIVIRSSDEGHEGVADLLEQLRRAGQ